MEHCPECDTRMKKVKSTEHAPIRRRLVEFNTECWECPKCGAQVYDEGQWDSAISKIKAIEKAMTPNISSITLQFSVGKVLTQKEAKEAEQHRIQKCA